jgi:hypothetical protein
MCEEKVSVTGLFKHKIIQARRANALKGRVCAHVYNVMTDLHTRIKAVVSCHVSAAHCFIHGEKLIS